MSISLLVPVVLSLASLCVSGSPENQMQQLQTEVEQLRNQGLQLHHRLRDLDHKMEEYNTEIGLLNNKLRADGAKTASVAFSARLSSTYDMDDSPTRFDSVTLNTGGGYNAGTGIFTAPTVGTYLLSVYTAGTGDDGPMYLRSNGAELCYIWMPGSGHPTPNCVVTAYLNAGDQVSFSGSSGDRARLRGVWSGIAGHIIVD